MIRSRLLALFLAAILPISLSACSGADTSAEEAHSDHGGIVVTDYSDKTELFVEFRPLVKDKRRRFDAHLTWLDSYKPVDAGTLTAELIWPDGGIDKASAKVSDTEGIFRPLLTASKSGKARLRLVLSGSKGGSVHDLGEIAVHASSEAGAKAAPQETEADGAIAFPKEVQWRIPFMAEMAKTEPLAQSIPVTVDVQLQPQAEAIVAAPVDGIVRATHVPIAGSSVRRGQRLATISSTLGGGEDVATLALAVREAEIERSAAAREVSRMDSLVRAEAVPRRRLDEARTGLRLAEARLASARSRRSAVAGGGAGVPLVAPISGEVLESSLVQGKGVTGGEQLLRIGNLSALWLVARVPEAQAVTAGNPAGIELILPDDVITLRQGDGISLAQKAGAVDPVTRTLPVIFAWNGRAVRPGQRLQGRLLTGGNDPMLVIPASAILNEGGQDVVYVQIDGETFQRRPVTIVRRSGKRVAIEGQLKAGERVVTRGVAAVRAAASTPDAFGHGHAH